MLSAHPCEMCEMSHNNPQQQLYSVIRQIPVGCVATYGQVAELAGLPGCARLVGKTLSQLPNDSDLPWHRVIAASGKISLPPQSESCYRQQNRLLEEGVEINQLRIKLNTYQWRP